jgi:hypothetical protein
LDGRETKILLVLLDLASQSPDFAVFLLDYRVESFALLAEYLDLVVAFGSESLEGVFILSQFLLEFVILGADTLELVLQFAQLASRQTQVFLCASDLFSETVVLSKQLLDALFVSLRLLGCRAESVLVFVEFRAEFLGLDCRQSQVLLYGPHLIS